MIVAFGATELFNDVPPLLHWYVYGATPPCTSAVKFDTLPLHIIETSELISTVKLGGFDIVALFIASQVFASINVTL